MQTLRSGLWAHSPPLTACNTRRLLRRQRLLHTHSPSSPYRAARGTGLVTIVDRRMLETPHHLVLRSFEFALRHPDGRDGTTVHAARGDSENASHGSPHPVTGVPVVLPCCCGVAARSRISTVCDRLSRLRRPAPPAQPSRFARSLFRPHQSAGTERATRRRCGLLPRTAHERARALPLARRPPGRANEPLQLLLAGCAIWPYSSLEWEAERPLGASSPTLSYDANSAKSMVIFAVSGRPSPPRPPTHLAHPRPSSRDAAVCVLALACRLISLTTRFFPLLH